MDNKAKKFALYWRNVLADSELGHGSLIKTEVDKFKKIERLV